MRKKLREIDRRVKYYFVTYDNVSISNFSGDGGTDRRVEEVPGSLNSFIRDISM